MNQLQRLRLGLDPDYMPVYIKGNDRYTHLLLIGKSGSGKSTSILNWWHDDAVWPYSKILIDPSGTLAKDAYSILKGKCHYCSLEHPLSLNPMHLPYDPNTISDLISEPEVWYK